jgi:precorrin-2 dehydrogenase/sirohydrochlorin ferrochelatase
MNSYQLYPLFVDVNGMKCLIVGGGKVAERKASSLIKAGAYVKVVSPHITDDLLQRVKEGQMEWEPRAYDSEQDGFDAVLVFAATNISEVNERVSQDALKRNQWVNRTDEPEEGNFINPAVIQKGLLNIAVTTSGASPTLAKQLRADIDEKYGVEIEMSLDWLYEKRVRLKREIANASARGQILRKLAELEPAVYFKKDQTRQLEEEAEIIIQQGLSHDAAKGDNDA